MLELILRLRFGLRYGTVFGDSRHTMGLRSCWSSLAMGEGGGVSVST